MRDNGGDDGSRRDRKVRKSDEPADPQMDESGGGPSDLGGDPEWDSVFGGRGTGPFIAEHKATGAMGVGPQEFQSAPVWHYIVIHTGEEFEMKASGWLLARTFEDAALMVRDSLALYLGAGTLTIEKLEKLGPCWYTKGFA